MNKLPPTLADSFHLGALDWRLGVTLPVGATESGQRFFETWARANALVPFIFGSTGKIVGLMARLADATLELPATSEHAGRATDDGDVEHGTMLAAHAQLVWEMLLCRHIDNFNSYLASLLSEAFLQKPAMLKESEKTIDWATVLSQSTIDDIVRVLAERKVHELAYGSFADLCTYFEKKRGIHITGHAERHEITKGIAIRNISVHNGCVVNAQYRKLVPGTSAGDDGTYKHLSMDDFRPLAVTLGTVVADLDRRAAKHFGLRAYSLEVDPHRHPLADEPPPSDDGLDELGEP